ncbi:MAG: hypothetical protein WBV67_04360 [Candidatus Cybelea sp.]|jgi:hypothetical protein
MEIRGAETIGDVISYLAPEVLSGSGPDWPPDAFAISATILKRSGAYRGVANAWPPKEYRDTAEWHNAVTGIAEQWRNSCDASAAAMPPQVREWWSTVLGHAALPLTKVLEDRTLFVALVGLVAACDFACRGFGFWDRTTTMTVKEGRANTDLLVAKTLCEMVDPSRCVVLPKAHNPFTGMTLRSLTHNLALWDRPEVSTAWESVQLDIPKGAMNLLLIPWPLSVSPNAFHPARDPHELRLPDRVGLFEYDIPFADTDIQKIAALVQSARSRVGEIHGIIFPELAMSSKQFASVREHIQEKFKIPLLVSGIGGTNPDKLGTNNVAISVHPELNEPHLQSKHHRWRIDEEQARSYDLLANLPPKKDNGAWWEGIEIEGRSCIFFNANDWLTFCVLICEDLARQDPASELVRSVGPSLVVALLLDAAQVQGRWPDRYATVLAEDPRSSVLTLTAAGLVDLAIRVRGGGNRSIALWREAFQRKSQEIILNADAEAVVLKIGSKMSMEWTADGRHDDGQTGYLSLMDITQVR